MVDFLHNPKNTNPHIGSVFMFISREADGTEGIIGLPGPMGGTMPAMTSETRLVELMKPIIKTFAKESGKAVHLIEFTGRKDHGEV